MRGVLNMRGGVAALAVAALAVLASGALAGEKLTKESDSDTVSQDAYAAAKAKCEPGTKAISGGFAFEDYVFDIPRSAGTGGRTWEAEALYFGAGNGTLTSFAYCRDEKVTRRLVTETLSPDVSATVKAKCGEGEKAVSGGFDGELYDPDTGNGPYIQPGTSRKAGPRGWKVRAGNFGDDPGTLTAQVNCREGRALKTRKKSETLDDEAFTVTAKCKRSQRVVSGGFSGADLSGPPDYLVPTASKKAGKRGWRLSGKADGEVTVYAYCERR